MRAHVVRDDILGLTDAATAVAVSVLLGNLRLLELPNGGSITLACVPLLAFSALRGVRRGLFVCSCAGLAHAASGGTIVHPVQLLLDYGVAYAAYALAGLAHCADGWRLRCAIVAAGCVSLTATTISGAVFFAQGLDSAAAARTYALLYNAATIVPEVCIALALVPLAARAIQRADPARALHSAPRAAAVLPTRSPRPAPAPPPTPLGSSRTRRMHAESEPLPLPRLQEERTPPRASPHAPAFIRPSPFARRPLQVDRSPS
jgi:thiamine transporter